MFKLRLENDSANTIDINDGINYEVLNCTGLNPPSASIFTAKSPNRKGLKYNGSTLNERNIVITIKILGDVEANRNNLYPWIDTEQYVKIYYQNGIKNVYCEGHVQDCEIELFTNSEVINLAIICEDPYFKDLEEMSSEISSLLKQFKFPFAIDSIGVPFSTMLDSNVVSVYNGGAETGAEIKITCNADIENLIIFDADDSSRRFKLKTKLLKDWIVIIDGDGSPKTVKAYKPDGTVENLLKYVDNNPTWFTIKKGYNKFDFTADSGENYADIQVIFHNKYLGV